MFGDSMILLLFHGQEYCVASMYFVEQHMHMSLGRYYKHLSVRLYSSDWRSDMSEEIQLNTERDAVRTYFTICPHIHLRTLWKNVQRNKVS